MSTQLWPKPIPIIGVTGEYASGKTLFALTIAPGPGTLVFDLEKSSESYLDLGFHRVDPHQEMLRHHPQGYRPRALWTWWRDEVLRIPPGKYRVIVLDPVSEIESALADYVQSHPGEFGRTLAQYNRASGLMWGDVKTAWKKTLSDLASRCETFVFVAHMGQVYAGNAPTGKRKPKGKETLEELASLYLQLERRPDSKGNVPAIPAAIVRKQRLTHTRISGATVEIIPALPPRLPVATPEAIRQYQRTPPDYLNLRPEERAVEEKASEEELAELRARAAEAEAEAERIKLERLDRMERSRVKPLAMGPPVPEMPEESPAAAAGATNGKSTGVLTVQKEPTQEEVEQLAKIRAEFFQLLKPENPKAFWQQILAKRHAESARELTSDQIHELACKLQDKIDEYRRAEIPF